MKHLHWKALEAYKCGDLKFLPRIPVRRDESHYQYTPMTNEYGEDNAVRAFHVYVVTYFGGDYMRAWDFITELIVYRHKHTEKARDLNATT